MADFIERPESIAREIQKRIVSAKRRKRRLVRVRLNPVESRILWEDLIELNQVFGDPTDDLMYAAWVAEGDYLFGETKIKLEVEGV